jgi:dolichol-phosphate mannosyltransferase
MAPSLVCELSLVCPAFNEADNVPELLAEWDRVLRSTDRTYEMIVVDDESRDATPRVLRDAMRMYPRLRVLRMRERAGQSAALAAGFAAARGRWIVTSDADLQNDPADLPRMLDRTQQFDMVCGWRRERRDTWTKRLTSRFANARRRKLLDDGVHDTGCGLKVFRRDIAERILQFDGMHRFFPALARIEGFTVTEVPVHHRPRARGKSKYWIFNRFRKPIQDLNGVAWYRARRLSVGADEITEPVGELPRVARAS